MASKPFQNLWLRVLSIAIATLLWLIVAGDRIVERVVRLPLEFQNLPAGLDIVTESPDAVEVRVRGPSRTLGEISGGNASVVLDLRTARAGQRLYDVTAGQIALPYGVQVVQVNPAALSIDFENTGVRIIPVRPAIEGRPGDGHDIAGVTATPATVEVVGPESALRAVEAATTEPVSVRGATGRVQQEVTVGVADRWVRLRKPQSASVSVHIVAMKR